MADVFTVLADLMKGQSWSFDHLAIILLIAAVFRLLHGSGWIHRDISVGNLYFYEGRGVLGDLEFAKRTIDTPKHDV